eukprot:3360417-Prymnesium_polylepis.2
MTAGCHAHVQPEGGQRVDAVDLQVAAAQRRPPFCGRADRFEHSVVPARSTVAGARQVHVPNRECRVRQGERRRKPSNGLREGQQHVVAGWRLRDEGRVAGRAARARGASDSDAAEHP